jgi:zinc protease
MRFYMGDEKTLQGRSTAAGMAGSLLMRGTTEHSRQELEDEIARLKATVRVDGDATSAFANIETTRENLPEVMRLVAEMLREPTFPDAEFDLLKEEMIASFEESKRDPFQVASTALQKHLSPWPANDPRFVETPVEAIASTNATTLDQVKQFHAGFYGASSGVAAVVGDFDSSEFESLVSELFGGWKSKNRFTRLADPYRERPVLVEELEIPDKESAVFMAGLPLDLRDTAREYPALVLGNFMTGGGFLNSRLATRIRQEEGISYGVGSFFYASAFENDSYFGSYAIYAPQNSELLIRAYKEEITRVLESGFAPDEIAQAKQGWLGQRKVSRSGERELAGMLARREYEGRTLEWDENLERNIESLTNEQIVAAMKKFLDVDKISMIQAGDFSKAKGLAENEKPKEEAALRN